MKYLFRGIKSKQVLWESFYARVTRTSRVIRQMSVTCQSSGVTHEMSRVTRQNKEEAAEVMTSNG
jgi:hypothetical protein